MKQKWIFQMNYLVSCALMLVRWTKSSNLQLSFVNWSLHFAAYNEWFQEVTNYFKFREMKTGIKLFYCNMSELLHLCRQVKQNDMAISTAYNVWIACMFRFPYQHVPNVILVYTNERQKISHKQLGRTAPIFSANLCTC